MQETFVCIPKVDCGVQKNTILDTISKSQIGIITRYIEIPWTNDSKFKRILMKIRWNTGIASYPLLKDRICEGGEVKLVYNPPYYWAMILGKK